MNRQHFNNTNYRPKDRPEQPPRVPGQQYPQRKPKPKPQQNGNNSNPIFSDMFLDVVGMLAKSIGQGGILIILLGVIVLAMTVDIAVGTLSLSLSFSQDVSFSGLAISSDTIAWGLSWITSGIQVFLRVGWITKRGKISKNEKYGMYGIMVADSILDAVAFGYLLTGKLPGEFNFTGMNFVQWLIMLIGTGACFIAENLVVYLASMRSSKATVNDILKRLKGR